MFSSPNTSTISSNTCITIFQLVSYSAAISTFCISFKSFILFSRTLSILFLIKKLYKFSEICFAVLFPDKLFFNSTNGVTISLLSSFIWSIVALPVLSSSWKFQSALYHLLPFISHFKA